MAAEVERRLLAQIYIKIDNTNVRDTAPELLEDLMRATVESSVSLPDMATLRFHNEDLAVSESGRFKVGQELRIELGDHEAKREVFIGEITDLELDFNASGQTPLIVRAYDRAHRLHRGRFTRTFQQMKDSDIAKKIAGELSLRADVQATREVHEYVLQNNQTNWDFLQDRAAHLGFELQVRDETLVFKPPPSTPGEANPIELSWGGTLHSLRARLTTNGQVNEVQVRGWDPVNKKSVLGKATRADWTPRIGETRQGGQVASDAFQSNAKILVAGEPVYSQNQAETLAQAVLEEMASGFVIAEGEAMGDPRIRLGSKVTWERAGRLFSGTYVITEVSHIYEAKGYHIEFKATGRRSTDISSLLTPPAAAASRPMHILAGVVTNNTDDRDLGRVKVKLPVLGDDIESHWCRLVTPGAGPNRGMEYLPEVEDEVLVIGSDINHLYVLGGLWNANDVPPEKSSEAVSGGRVAKRVIRSRSGHVILLDDSDGGGGITIVDSSESNKIVIDTSKNNLEMTVQGDIKIQAGGKLELVAGTEAKIEARTEFSAEGGSAASVQSSGRTEIKGSMVNIGQ